MKTLSSTKTDGSSYSYYAWVNYENGRIKEIHEDLGREGGLLWSAKFNANGRLLDCMKDIAENWPKLYSAVRKACPKENLPTLSTIQEENLQRDLDRLQKKIAYEEKRLRELKKERLKLWKKKRR